jgi:hypothetical protein
VPSISVSLEVQRALRSVSKPGQHVDDVLREMLDLPERRLVVATPLLPIGTLDVGSALRIPGDNGKDLKQACRMCRPRTYKVDKMLGYFLVTRLT